MKNQKIASYLKKVQGILKTFFIKSEISQYISHIILSIMLGVAAGSGAILFHYTLEQLRRFFEPQNFTSLFHVENYFIVAIPIAGGIITSLMTRLSPVVAKEKGVLHAIKAIIINKGIIPLRVTLFHTITSIISIGTGAPLGPEGPVAKIGSGMGSFLSRIFRLQYKDVMMYTASGAGAAIAAVFNAPIAGVFFGIEVVMLNDLKNRALSALIISCVVADILSRAILGNHHIFTIPHYSLGSIKNYPYYFLLGVMSGIVSILYFLFSKWYGKLINEKLAIKNNFIKLLPITIVFGLILLKYYNLFGIGYSTINEIFASKILLKDVFVLFILKTLFLVLFLKSGAYGGTFAPALSIGAFFGFSFASIINILFHASLDPVSFAIVGMGGILAGFNSIPITAVMLVFEVTNDYKFILPLMLVSIISYLVTIYFNKNNVYTLELLEEGIDVTKKGEVDLLGKVKVIELMKRDFEKVNHNMPLKVLLHILMNALLGDVFVVDDKDNLIGIVTLKDVRQAILDNDLLDLLITRDVMTPVPSVKEMDPVSLAIQQIKFYDIENIPVIKSDSKRTIVGVLTHQDIIQAYNKLLEGWETNQFLINYPQK